MPRPWTLAGGASLWAMGLIGAPLWPAPLAALAYAVGSRVCHQIAARSWHLAGAQTAVCARCAGIYLAVSVGLVLWAARPGSRPRPSGWSARALVIAGAAPLVVSVALEWVRVWDAGNVVRFVTGTIFGAALAALVVRAAATVDYQRA